MVQICKQENCPKPSHQTSTHRVCLAPSRAGLFGTAQHWQILPGFPLKRLQHSHTPLLYLLEWSGGPLSFKQGMQTPQHFPKGPSPPKHSPQESKLQLFQMGWGQDWSLQRASAWQNKGGTFTERADPQLQFCTPQLTSTGQKAVTTYQEISGERPHTNMTCTGEKGTVLLGGGKRGKIARTDLLVQFFLFEAFASKPFHPFNSISVSLRSKGEEAFTDISPTLFSPVLLVCCQIRKHLYGIDTESFPSIFQSN